MVKLIEFEELRLPITWNLIDIGFKSDTVFRDELLASDIVEYAISLLAFDDSNLVLELAAEDKRDTEQIDKYVKNLHRRRTLSEKKNMRNGSSAMSITIFKRNMMMNLRG